MKIRGRFIVFGFLLLYLHIENVVYLYTAKNSNVANRNEAVKDNEVLVREDISNTISSVKNVFDVG